MRTATVTRETKETQIKLSLNLDGMGKADIKTGIGFFDHMLTAFAVHSGIDLTVACQGDIEVDSHHTIEDVGIVLGQAFLKALGNRAGIARYGYFILPMDEALAMAAIDISNRAYLVFNGDFQCDKIGTMDTQMIEEFWRAFAMNAAVTLHIKLVYGSNDHHKAEAIFKAVAHAIKKALIVQKEKVVLSTKGCL